MSRNIRIKIDIGWQDQKHSKAQQILYIDSDEELYNIVDLISRAIEDDVAQLQQADKEGTWGAYNRQAS